MQMVKIFNYCTELTGCFRLSPSWMLTKSISRHDVALLLADLQSARFLHVLSAALLPKASKAF